MGHKSDIGGQSPGSRNTLARDVFGEGLQIMPVRFLSKREPVKETHQLVRSNSRAPSWCWGIWVHRRARCGASEHSG